MEHKHHPQQIYGLHAFLRGLGAEAVLPSDICYDLPHVAAYVEADNEKAR